MNDTIKPSDLAMMPRQPQKSRASTFRVRPEASAWLDEHGNPTPVVRLVRLAPGRRREYVGAITYEEAAILADQLHSLIEIERGRQAGVEVAL